MCHHSSHYYYFVISASHTLLCVNCFQRIVFQSILTLETIIIIVYTLHHNYRWLSRNTYVFVFMCVRHTRYYIETRKLGGFYRVFSTKTSVSFWKFNSKVKKLYFTSNRQHFISLWNTYVTSYMIIYVRVLHETPNTTCYTFSLRCINV